MPKFGMKQFRQQIRDILTEQQSEDLPLIEKVLKTNKVPRLPKLPKV